MQTTDTPLFPGRRISHGIDDNNEQQLIKFPDIIIGREKETKELTETFRSVCGGSSALTLISGHAGIGKTSLVKNISSEVIEAGALFVSVKADQYNSDTPCQTYAEVVKTLIKHLLMLDNRTLASFKKSLSEALGEDIHLLSNFIPEIEHITGYPVNKLTAENGNPENRFKDSLSTFIKKTTGLYPGIVIFFDDLHWADSDTIKIIKHIIGEKIPNLYILGAYRENEVNDDHPLAKMITWVSISSDGLHLLKLNTLEYIEVEDILTATLKDNSPQIKKLSLYIFNKTGGNPFYMHEFIQNLVIRKCLLYKNCQWIWDEQKSMTISATENILNLLSGMIKTLNDNEQKILETAACMGSRFSTKILELVSGTKHSLLAGILNRLENTNYIIRTEEAGIFAFSHDKIREAAYGLMTENQKSKMHGKTGETLLSIFGATDEYIFAITDHLNRADRAEIDITELMKLNLEAGLKAKTNFAYEAGISYLGKAIELYKNTGIDDCRLNFRMMNTYCDCLYLNADYEKAEKAIYETIEMTDEAIEKADLYSRIITMKTLQLNYDESVNICLDALRLFNIKFETDPDAIERELKNVNLNLVPHLRNISVDDILNLSVCERPDIHMITQLLKNLCGSFYHLGNWKFVYLIHSKIVSLTLKYGITIDSPEGFVGYAMTNIILWNDIDLGYKLGNAAWRLSCMHGKLSQLSNVSLHYGVYILFWKKHLKHSLDIIQTGLDAGIKSGEYLFVGYSISHIVFGKFFTGYNLNLLFNELDKELLFIRKLKNELIYNVLAGLKLLLSNLSGKTESKECFNFNGFKEQELLAECDDKKLFLVPANYSLYKSIILYIYGDYNESLQLMKKVEEYSTGLLGSFHIFEYNFYQALNLAALIPENKEYQTHLEQLELMFNEYALECPENFLCRHLLIKAERARLNNDIAGAMSLYDKAISSARENEFIQIEAIACERAGLFWISLAKRDFAAIYLKRAYALFGKWGADMKLDCMKKQYPDLLPEHPGLDELTGTDILSLLNHFNQISCSLEIDTLLETLSGIMLLYSGADMFTLIIEHEGTMLIQVLAAPDSAGTNIMLSLPVDECQNELVPIEILHYIKNTGDSEVVYDGNQENIFHNIPYIKKVNPASALCLRSDAGAYKTIMYFENRFKKCDYSGSKKTLLRLLTRQAAICLQNAFYTRENSRKREKTALSFKTSGMIKTIPYDSILYFSSEGRHTSVFSTDGVYDIPVLLKDIEKELPPDFFIRMHKQHIVNLNNISGINRDYNGRLFVRINDNINLPVGRFYHEAFNEKLKHLSVI